MSSSAALFGIFPNLPAVVYAPLAKTPARLAKTPARRRQRGVGCAEIHRMVEGERVGHCVAVCHLRRVTGDNIWAVKCDCGAFTEKRAHNFRSGRGGMHCGHGCPLKTGGAR